MIKEPKRAFSFFRAVIFVSLYIGVFFFYFWTAEQGFVPKLLSQPLGYYNIFSNAVLAGQLSLLEFPRAELLALSDPYDPIQNEAYRMHDLSLFKGKYFFPFGPAPAFLLFIPFRIFHLGYMPESMAVALFFSGGLLASVALLKSFLKDDSRGQPFFLCICSIALLGLGNSILFTLRRPLFYEVAIACGYFCLMLALLFIVSWHLKKFYGFWRPLLGSLFLGLAVGSRPNLILAAFILPLISVYILKREPRVEKPRTILFHLWTPFCTILFLLLGYNYLRFDSIFEFGFNYQLAGFHPQKIRPFTFESLLPGLYFYIIQPLRFEWQFPYVYTDYLKYPGQLPSNYVGLEPVAGIIYLSPIVLFLILLPLCISIKRESPNGFFKEKETAVRYTYYFLTAGFLQIVFLSLKPGVTMRYTVDFMPMFLLSSLMTWFAILDFFQKHSLVRKVFHFLGILAIFYGLIVNMAISFTGYHDNFRKNNPESYHSIKNFFEGVEKRF